MDIIQLLSILATVLGSAYYIHREMQADMRIIRDEMNRREDRTDKLYEMFVQLQNEIKALHGRTCIVETKMEPK